MGHKERESCKIKIHTDSDIASVQVGVNALEKTTRNLFSHSRQYNGKNDIYSKDVVNPFKGSLCELHINNYYFDSTFFVEISFFGKASERVCFDPDFAKRFEGFIESQTEILAESRENIKKMTGNFLSFIFF